MKVQHSWKTRVVSVVLLFHVLVQTFFRQCFCSSDEVAWSLSAPQVFILYMFFTRCCYFSNFASFCRRVVCVGCEVCFVVFFRACVLNLFRTDWTLYRQILLRD